MLGFSKKIPTLSTKPETVRDFYKSLTVSGIFPKKGALFGGFGKIPETVSLFVVFTTREARKSLLADFRAENRRFSWIFIRDHREWWAFCEKVRFFAKIGLFFVFEKQRKQVQFLPTPAKTLPRKGCYRPQKACQSHFYAPVCQNGRLFRKLCDKKCV